MGDARELVVRADEVLSFSRPGEEDEYTSQCLIEKDGVGSSELVVTRYILRPHRTNTGGVHPRNDEAYYVLRGTARLTLGGRPEDGEGGRQIELGPDMAVFIPAGTFHRLSNRSDEDFVILAIWPRSSDGVSGVYAERKRLWGTGFRKVSSV